MNESLKDAMSRAADGVGSAEPDLSAIERRGRHRRTRRRSATAISAVFVVAAVAVPLYGLSGIGAERTGGPVAPAEVGPLIAYTTMGNDAHLRIALMRPDGSGATPVTTGKEPDNYVSRFGFSQDLDPQWSPDGQRILFLRRYGESIYSLCSVTPAGEGFEVLVRTFPAGMFALSPSGSEVAFGVGHGIHVMNVNGSNDQVVARTRDMLPNGVPISWSPDGREIVFSSGRSTLSIADIASGQVTTPMPGFRVDAVAWDPIGPLIAFAGRRLEDPNSAFEQVWVVRPDGTDLRLVTQGTSNWTVAGWSPDGTQLVVGRLDHRLRDDGLAVINIDGTGSSVIQPSAMSAWAAWRR
jgi:Tol biopolymer transport system component